MLRYTVLNPANTLSSFLLGLFYLALEQNECGQLLKEIFLLVNYYPGFVYSYFLGIKVRCYFLDYSTYRK